MVFDMNLISLYTMGFLKLLFVLLFMHIQGEPLQLRTLDWSTYSEPGDLSIGGVFPIHRYDKKGKLCSETLLGTLQTQFVQAMVFGIQEINKRSDILPNITLGFVIMDDCTSENVALARAMSFLPRSKESHHTCPSNQNASRNSNTSHYGDHHYNSTQKESPSPVNVDPHTPVPHHDVVAVLGAMRSQNSLLMAEVLGLFQVRTLIYVLQEFSS